MLGRTSKGQGPRIQWLDRRYSSHDREAREDGTDISTPILDRLEVWYATIWSTGR